MYVDFSFKNSKESYWEKMEDLIKQRDMEGKVHR